MVNHINPIELGLILDEEIWTGYGGVKRRIVRKLNGQIEKGDFKSEEEGVVFDVVCDLRKAGDFSFKLLANGRVYQNVFTVRTTGTVSFRSTSGEKVQRTVGDLTAAEIQSKIYASIEYVKAKYLAK